MRAVGIAAVVVTTLAAAPPQAKSGSGLQTSDFRVETNQTQSNLNTGEFTMPGHVKFYRPGSDVVGDRAKGNYKDGLITITGHVVMHDSGNSAEAASAGAPSGGGPATLGADQLQIDSKRKIYIATGHVRYVQGTRSATAASGRLDEGAHTLDLNGDVHLADGGNTLSSEHVHYDTLTKDVTTSGSPTVLTQPGTFPAPGGANHSTLPTPRRNRPKPKRHKP